MVFSSEQNSLPDAVYIPVGETINTSKINRILVISAEEKQSREGRWFYVSQIIRIMQIKRTIIQLKETKKQ